MDKSLNHAINNLPWKFEWLENAMKYWISDSKGALICATKDRDEARHIAACVNYCEGIPTEELESKGKDAGFWGRACSRLEGERDELKAQNAALRAENERLKSSILELGNQL